MNGHYMVCIVCGGDILEDRAAAVNNSASVEEFLLLVEMGIASHQNRN